MDEGAGSLLFARGFAVTRGAVAADAALDCFNDAVTSLDEMLALPGRSYGTRHFLNYNNNSRSGRNAAATKAEYVPSRSMSVDRLLCCLIRGGVGKMVSDALGMDAFVSEVTAIASLPGTDAQSLHADSNWDNRALQLITVFVALHDISKDMGPTEVCADTHTPACFASNKWLPPPGEHYNNPLAATHLAQATFPQAFVLSAGDALSILPTTWHRGGRNASSQRRVVLAVSFKENNDVDKDAGKRRISEFLS